MTSEAPTRLRDWQSRLQAVLTERRPMPFEWGANDCCTFAADCVLAMTGQDPAEGMRAHRTAEEARELIKAKGSIRAIADGYAERIPPVMARVGDVGLVKTPEGPALAVCMGLHWTHPGPRGLVTLPIGAASRAWRV